MATKAASKKKPEEMTAEELREQLKAEQDRSAKLQDEKEARDTELEKERAAARERDERTRADAAAATRAEPSEEQWVKLEEEYGQTRDVISKQWKMIQRANAPLVAALSNYQTRDAALENVRQSKESVKLDDPQFPKYERYVDEYLNDVPVGDKADQEKLKRHMDRAIHFARGKARATDKSFREEVDETRDTGTAQDKADAAEGFGEFTISGIPLTITNDKLVPDDFRKRHAHPDQKEGVRMDERARWQEGVPKKPR